MGDPGSSWCDSEAAGLHTRRCYISMNRAVGARGDAGDGGDPFSAGPLGESDNGAALNITALVFDPGKQGEAPGAQLASTVGRSRSRMPTP
jgi:hypothetical protein